MLILPAIDLYDGKAVRLFRGDYAQMTVYSDDPLSVARDFEAAGAEYVHMVDLAGAKDGTTPNFSTVAKIARETSLRVEIGGGIRSEETVRRYPVENPVFACRGAGSSCAGARKAHDSRVDPRRLAVWRILSDPVTIPE